VTDRLHSSAALSWGKNHDTYNGGNWIFRETVPVKWVVEKRKTLFLALPTGSLVNIPTELSSYTIIIVEGKGKGKVHHKTSHAGQDGQQRYSSSLSLTKAPDGVGIIIIIIITCVCSFFLHGRGVNADVRKVLCGLRHSSPPSTM
jgi:hypothetical protein